MMMPGADGAELVAVLRKWAEMARVPILVLTAWADEELPERMLRGGAQDYVLKPVRRGELRARIENLLDMSGSRHHLQRALQSKEESLERLARMAARRKEKLERACSQLLEEGFVDRATGGPLRLHVNLSARQLEDPDVVQRTRAVLERTGFPASSLCLEITESAATRQPEAVEQLKGIGVDLAIDDFGTRYSTLSQLRRLRVDALKIDRTFVDGMLEDERDRAIVETILTLGRTLKLAVAAEGIEGEDQLEALRELACDEAQGFHLARPQPAGELRELLIGEDGPAQA